MNEFINIEPRHRQDDHQSDEAYEATKADVKIAMDALFGSRRSVSAGEFTVGGMSYITHNGMPTINTRMSDTESGRARLEKARRDIEAHKAEFRLRDLAERITLDELQNDIQEIRKWANSLHKKAA